MTPEKPKRPRRLGLRCEAMLILGAVWVVMGAAVKMGASRPPTGLIFTMIPTDVRAFVWIVTGAAAIVTGLRSSGSSRALGALMAMPLLRSFPTSVFFVAHIPPGILRDFPSPDRGRCPNAPKE